MTIDPKHLQIFSNFLVAQNLNQLPHTVTYLPTAFARSLPTTKLDPPSKTIFHASSMTIHTPTVSSHVFCAVLSPCCYLCTCNDHCYCCWCTSCCCTTTELLLYCRLWKVLLCLLVFVVGCLVYCLTWHCPAATLKTTSNMWAELCKCCCYLGCLWCRC